MFPLFDLTAKRADLTPDRPAMTEWATGRRLSYADLDGRAGRAASVLAEAGIGPGDRVAVLCRNRIAFFELLFACAKLGAILVPLNWRMPTTELKPLVADSDSRLLAFGAEDEATARALGTAAIGLDASGPDGYEALCAAAPPHPGRHHWPAGETWYLLYTSGTTGQPKAVIQTYGMAMANYVNLSRAVDLRADDSTLNFLPLFHTAGINLHTLPTLIAGGHVTILPGFDADAVVNLLADGAIDTFFGVPAVYRALNEHPRLLTADLTRVRHWGCGGAPLADELVQSFAAHGALVCNGCGMTETGPTAFLMDGARVTAKPGSVGKPQLLVAARIVDAEGKDVAEGRVGEIWLSGPAVTPGYWRRPEATADAFAGNWLRTGDLGRRDEDGYYYIAGRLKDMYISGGENVFPAEVEAVLTAHPAVLEAAVIGVRDAHWGEAGRAFLMIKDGAAMPAADDLSTFCRQRLAAYKVPKGFHRVDDFPRTAAGKIQKHLIAEPEPA